MSYLFVVVIAAIAGFVAGKFLKGSEHGSGFDAAVGAAGGCLAVILSRVLGSDAAVGYAMSTIVAIAGALLALFATRHFMRVKPVPVRARRR